ncbi:uncharacterized protein LOC128208582 [Mya arenaria]|uniref:uncharacterized protein LOC128208582 n=1 Tax=Mya arenaria TaxID=6604 RepID=UPI0022E4EBCB|nr:uncharacterized protein LOC128208582 [Mya arenaria]
MGRLARRRLRFLAVAVFITGVPFLVVQHNMITTEDLQMCAEIRADLQPDVESDFPTVKGVRPRIPHIIHQTYRNETVPFILREYARSFIANHPDWQYKFWSDADGRHLIQERHPYLLQTWDGYQQNIQRADALRYSVLYEYGGVYADLDVENLRPLDRATMKYSCIIPTEPFEHSIFLYNSPYLINNAFIMCRAKHPFFKQVLLNLVKTSTIQTTTADNQVMMTTGPLFFTNEFNNFMGIDQESTNIYRKKTDWSSNSPYFYKGERKEDDEDGIYVPNTRYFTDEVDDYAAGVVENMCKDRFRHCDNVLLQRGCVEAEARGLNRKHRLYTFNGDAANERRATDNRKRICK